MSIWMWALVILWIYGAVVMSTRGAYKAGVEGKPCWHLVNGFAAFLWPPVVLIVFVFLLLKMIFRGAK